MELLFLRHGPAGDKRAFARSGRPDAERPLTERGARKTERAVAGLRKVLPRLDAILTSPALRARQTARILRRAYPRARWQELDALRPEADSRQAAAALRRAVAGLRRAAVVGHEPGLGRLAACLLGTPRVRLRLKKAGSCLLSWSPGHGCELLWLLAPKQSRRLGRR